MSATFSPDHASRQRARTFQALLRAALFGFQPTCACRLLHPLTARSFCSATRKATMSSRCRILVYSRSRFT